MISRLTSLIRKAFIQILRDPRTLGLVIVMPIMQLLLLGYAATNDIRNVPMAVFDQDHSSASRRLLEGTPASIRSRMDGRIVEVVGEPLAVLRGAAGADPDVENAQMFGDRLHLRVRESSADSVIRRPDP